MGDVRSSKHSYYVGGGRVTGCDIVRSHNEPLPAGRTELEQQHRYGGTSPFNHDRVFAPRTDHHPDAFLFCAEYFMRIVSNIFIFFFFFFFGSGGVHVCMCVKRVNTPTSIHL